MLDEVFVAVIGENRMQNELLVNFLSEKAGFKCETYSNFPPLTRVYSYVHRIALIDTKTLDKKVVWGMCDRAGESYDNKYNVLLAGVSEKDGIENEALARGVRGVLYRNERVEIIPQAIKAVVRGELWYSRKALSNAFINSDFPPHDDSVSQALSADVLSFREKDIIKKLAGGKSNKEIAEELQISHHTIKTHLYHIYKKIGVNTRLKASLWAKKHL